MGSTWSKGATASSDPWTKRRTRRTRHSTIRPRQLSAWSGTSIKSYLKWLRKAEASKNLILLPWSAKLNIESICTQFQRVTCIWSRRIMTLIWVPRGKVKTPAFGSTPIAIIIIIHRQIRIVDQWIKKRRHRLNLYSILWIKRMQHRLQVFSQKDNLLKPHQTPRPRNVLMAGPAHRFISFPLKSSLSSKRSWRHILPQKRKFPWMGLPSCEGSARRLIRKAFGKCSRSAWSRKCCTTSSRLPSNSSASSKFVSK